MLDGPLLIGHVELDVDVRVRPLEGRDGPHQAHPLRGVEHREGVMRDQRWAAREAGQDDRHAREPTHAHLPFFAAASSARAALRILRNPQLPSWQPYSKSGWPESFVSCIV